MLMAGALADDRRSSIDFEWRRVSILVEPDGKQRLIVQGAPEELLRLCRRYEEADGQERPLDAEMRRSFEAFPP